MIGALPEVTAVSEGYFLVSYLSYRFFIPSVSPTTMSTGPCQLAPFCPVLSVITCQGDQWGSVEKGTKGTYISIISVAGHIWVNEVRYMKHTEIYGKVHGWQGLILTLCRPLEVEGKHFLPRSLLSNPTAVWLQKRRIYGVATKQPRPKEVEKLEPGNIFILPIQGFPW